MTIGQRRAHVVVWVVLAAALAAGVVASVAVRPEDAAERGVQGSRP